MKTQNKKKMIIGVCFILLFTSGLVRASAPSQPQQNLVGYGSAENYIATDIQHNSAGSRFTGSRVHWYLPNKLKNGNSAPVVVLLHGKFFVDPAMYDGLIMHLARQGIIVIFPHYERETIFKGVLQASHIDMMSNAIEATEYVFDRLPQAEEDNIYLFGHSLGGMLALCWKGFGGPDIRGIMVATPFLRDNTGMPITPKPLDHELYIPQNTVPVLMISADNDTLTGTPQAEELFEYVPAGTFYEMVSDDHGEPAMLAEHMTPTQANGRIPGFIWQGMTGGAPTMDAYDWRVIYTGIDAVIDGQTLINFDMGVWSDGVPVKPLRLKQSK